MKLAFTGDIYFSPERKNTEFTVSEKIKEIINQCDKICINLEGPVKAEKNMPSKKIGPGIYQDREKVEQITKENKIIYNLANNHIMDYGKDGYIKTISVIGNENLGAGSNEKAYEPYMVESNGIKVALISVAEAGFGVVKSNENSEYGYAWFRDKKIKENIKKYKEICNYVIVISHAGLEDVNIPLPEIRELYKEYIDCGADLVIGHHPHVIQGMEEYKGCHIFYSLGNCVFDRLDGKGEYNPDSIGVLVDLDDVVKTEVVPLVYKNGKLDVSDNCELFDAACKSLLNDKYIDDITNVCREYYEKYYRMYYRGINGRNNRLYNVWKAFLYLIGVNTFNDDMVYHNLEIETHYWTTVRGLNEVRKANG